MMYIAFLRQLIPVALVCACITVGLSRLTGLHRLEPLWLHDGILALLNIVIFAVWSLFRARRRKTA